LPNWQANSGDCLTVEHITALLAYIEDGVDNLGKADGMESDSRRHGEFSPGCPHVSLPTSVKFIQECM
jgi:hypothetical protein